MSKNFENITVKDTLNKIFSYVRFTFLLVLIISIISIGFMIASLFGHNNLKETAPFICIICMIVTMIIATLSFLWLSSIRNGLTKTIFEPLHAIKEATTRMKHGDLNIVIDCEETNEFGELSNDLTELCTILHAIINDMTYLLTEMSNGNFDINTANESSYVGEFHTLLFTMRKMNRQLDTTLKQFNEVSEQIATGVIQLSDNSQTLSDGSSNQVDAIESLVDAVETVLQTSKQNTTDATGAAQIISSVARDASESQQELKNLTNAIDRISESSLKIQDIIGAIEDIASQTNLLSLNASIEAARAGEAGKGFAVVADQIGKLAEDSAKSAISTKTLIEQTLIDVQHGTEITQKAVDAFHEILESLNDFTDLTKQASDESQSQSEMLSQINYGLGQIEFIVQSNSSVADETLVTSTALSDQSTSLKELVDYFQLRKA